MVLSPRERLKIFSLADIDCDLIATMSWGTRLINLWLRVHVRVHVHPHVMWYCMHEATLLVMERWRGKVALITGASSGIGYLLAKQLAEMGMAVVRCARNTTKIEVLSIIP